MTTEYHTGWDFMPTAAKGPSTTALLEADGWYLRQAIFGAMDWGVNAPGRFGFGKALAMAETLNPATLGCSIIRPTQAQRADGYMGMAINIAAETGSCRPMMGVFDAVAGIPLIEVVFDLYGVIKVFRGDYRTGDLLISSAVGSFLETTTFFAEVYFKPATTGGEVEVRINTVPKITLGSSNTLPVGASGDYFDAIMIGADGPSAGSAGVPLYVDFDDLYFNNSLGAKNNTFAGNARTRTAFMVGAGDSTDLLIAGGAPANWAAVDNTALTTGGGYVYTPTVGDYDLYDPDPIMPSAPVLALTLRSAMAQDDATQLVGRNVLKMGGVQVEGADHYLNQTQAYCLDVFENDPSTGLGMDGTDVNACQVGPKLHASA